MLRSDWTTCGLPDKTLRILYRALKDAGLTFWADKNPWVNPASNFGLYASDQREIRIFPQGVTKPVFNVTQFNSGNFNA